MGITFLLQMKTVCEENSLVHVLKASLSDKASVFCPLYQVELTSITWTRSKPMALGNAAFRNRISGFHLNSVSLELLPGSQRCLGVGSVLVSEFVVAL